MLSSPVRESCATMVSTLFDALDQVYCEVKRKHTVKKQTFNRQSKKRKIDRELDRELKQLKISPRKAVLVGSLQDKRAAESNLSDLLDTLKQFQKEFGVKLNVSLTDSVWFLETLIVCFESALQESQPFDILIEVLSLTFYANQFITDLKSKVFSKFCQVFLLATSKLLQIVKANSKANILSALDTFNDVLLSSAEFCFSSFSLAEHRTFPQFNILLSLFMEIGLCLSHYSAEKLKNGKLYMFVATIDYSLSVFRFVSIQSHQYKSLVEMKTSLSP